MKQTFHIIGKDIRDLRLLLPLAGWWSVSILQALLISVSPRLPSSPPAIEMMSGVFLGGLAWLLAALDLGLLVLIVSQLAQRDSTVGTTAFWLSRPISGARLLAGKSLFLLLAVMLPTVVVQFLMLLFSGVTLYDAVRSAPQIVVLQLLVLSALMMLACLTSNLSRMLFLGVIAAVGLAIVQYTLRLPLLRNRWDRSLDDSAVIGFSLFLLAVALVVVCHQYLARRTKPKPDHGLFGFSRNDSFHDSLAVGFLAGGVPSGPRHPGPGAGRGPGRSRQPQVSSMDEPEGRRMADP